MLRTIVGALAGTLLAFAVGVGGPALSLDAPIPATRLVGAAPESAPLVNLVVLGDS